MTRKSGKSYHFTQAPSATKRDASQVKNKQSHELVTGPQVGTDASLVEKHPNDRDDKPTDTKRRPRLKTNPSTTAV